MHDLPAVPASVLFALLHTAGAAEAHLESRLATIGLSVPKLAALTALREAGESLPLGQLAERLSCVKSNITQLVDRLEADGFVKRLADPADRRTRLAVLTGAGRTACDEGARLRDAAAAELVGGISADEARQLAGLIAKIDRGTG